MVSAPQDMQLSKRMGQQQNGFTLLVGEELAVWLELTTEEQKDYIVTKRE